MIAPARVIPSKGKSIDLSRSHVEVSRARRAVRELLQTWNLDRLADDAQVIVSELVTNAIRMRGKTVTLIAALEPGFVFLGVWDESPVVPSAGECDLEALTGRGLTIVASLSAKHGVEPMHDEKGGKVVWVRMEYASAEASRG